MTLDEKMFLPEPVKGIAHGPGGQGSLPDEILLRQLAALFQDFVHELCRWGQVPDLSDGVIPAGVYNKNDPS